MKLHDLHPAEGSRQPRTRVGRGIAAGKGKTAGRGTKGQKARAGGSIPPWFEGGQTPLHMRIPKLRGFKNRFKIEYEVVNVGAIGALAERGAFEVEATGGKSAKVGPGHGQPGHPARRRSRADAEQATQDPGRRRPVGPALRGRRRVHRIGPSQDRGCGRQRQRPRDAEQAARRAGGHARGRRRHGVDRRQGQGQGARQAGGQARGAGGHRRGRPRPPKPRRMQRPRLRKPQRARPPRPPSSRPRPADEAEAATDEPEATAEPADAGTASADEPEATAERDADEPSAAESAADEPSGDDA